MTVATSTYRKETFVEAGELKTSGPSAVVALKAYLSCRRNERRSS